MTKAHLMCGSTALALLTMSGMSPAYAQGVTSDGVESPQSSDPEPAQASQDAGNDIVVTARRVSETLREVPASVSVLSTETLEQARVRTGEDFIRLTSGVSIITGAINAADVQVNIRGINGNRDAPSNVALVVDGVQKANAAALVQNQGALQQVEVLKGPQGALYGRNAIGGAFVVTTKRPGDELSGQASISYGNNESYEAYALLSGPLSDSLGFSFSGDWSRTDGFFRNSFLPTELNQVVYPGNSSNAASVDNSEQWNVYGRLLWSPTDDTELDAKVRYGELRGSAINFNAVFNLPGLAAASGNPQFNQDINTHDFVYAFNIDPRNGQSNLELSLRGEHNFGDVTLNGYVSYNDFKNNQNSDNPASAAFGYFSAEPTCVATTAALQGVTVQAPFGIGGGAFLPPYSPTTCDGSLYEQHDQRDFSAELRLVSDPAAALRWQLGVFYADVRNRDCIATQIDVGRGFAQRCFSTDPDTRTEGLSDDVETTKNYAVFAGGEYEFFSRLKVGVALRYDREERDTRNLVPTDARTLYIGNVLTGFPNGTPTSPANYFLNAGLDPAFNPSGRLDPRSAVFEQWQPKITLAYKASDDVSLFANWGIGFKSGGFNSGGTAAIVNGFFNDVFNANVNVSDDFRKEVSSAFEVGIKGRAFDRRLNFELAAYHTDVDDSQQFQFFVGPFGVLRVIENIDEVRIQGIEGSVDFRVLRGWTLSASANYLDSEIRRNTTRPNTVGNQSPNTPEYTLNFGSQVDADLSSSVRWIWRTDVRVTGPTYFSTVQDQDVPNIFPFGPGNFRNSRRDAYTIVNSSLGLEFSSITVTAFVSNLFNTEFIKEGIVTPEFGGSFISPGDRRSYGLELGYKF